MSDETTLWKGSPSQWLNTGPFAAAGLVAVGVMVGSFYFEFIPALIGLLVPVLYVVWCFLGVRCRIFELTTQRLRITTGVINQQIDEIELYRVKDIQMLRPWWMRITGLGAIELKTSDRTTPHLIIPAIRNGVELREELRKQVEAQRDSKRVREMDFDESSGSDGDFDGGLGDGGD